MAFYVVGMDIFWNCTFIVLSDLTDNCASLDMIGEERAVVVVVVGGGGGGGGGGGIIIIPNLLYYSFHYLGLCVCTDVCMYVCIICLFLC